jgi:hypothetical protein
MNERTIEQVLRAHTDEWMSIPGVVGTGLGERDGEPCIRIFVTRKTQQLLQKLPSAVDGFVVDVVQSGEFTPRDPHGI